jgi:hypothetical protein
MVDNADMVAGEPTGLMCADVQVYHDQLTYLTYLYHEKMTSATIYGSYTHN